MTRLISALVIALAATLLPLTHLGQPAHASGGNNDLQTVALHRQDCTQTNMGPTVGTARFSLDDQGGNPGGVEIDISVTAGLPRSNYSVSVLVDPCQTLAQEGTLKTDDSGRGDLEFHVPGSLVPSGASLRVQLVAPSDLMTSDPTTPL